MMMPHSPEVNEIIQDHRKLTDWSGLKNDSAGNKTEFTLSIDMVFNDGHRLSIIVYSILLVISALGNLTVLYLLTKRRIRGPSRIDIMLMHLAIADLLVTFLMMPMEIAWAWTVTWNAGDFMCRIMAFFRTFGLYLSSFVLVCISVDRYFAVLKPLKLSDTRGRMMLSVAWIMSIIFSTPQAIVFHVEQHPEVVWFQQCVTFHSFPDEFHNILYSIMGMVAMYAFPLVIIIFCYASIYMEIYRKSKKVFKGAERFRRSNDDVLSRAKRRTLKMTVTIVIVFVICWTPFYVMSILYWLDREKAMLIDQKIQKGLFLFASTNSCMNPIVYGIFNIRARDHSNLNNTINNRHASISKRVDALNNSVTRRGSGMGTPRKPSNSSIVIKVPDNSKEDLRKELQEQQLQQKQPKSQTNGNVRRTICMSCGEAIELPNLRNHNNSYH